MDQLFDKRLETLGKEATELDAWQASEFKDKAARERAEHWRVRSNIASALIRRLGTADPLEADAADRFAAMRDATAKFAEEHPAAGVFLRAAELRHATEAAHREAPLLLNWLSQQESPLNSDQTAQRVARLIGELTHAQRHGADDDTLVYQLATVVERMNQLGLAHSDYLQYEYGETGSAAIGMIDRGVKLLRTVDSVQEFAD